MSPNYLLIRALLAEVARTGRADLARFGELDAAFGGRDAALLALHHRWRTAFFARLDAVLEDPPPDLDTAVRALWNDPAIGGRGLRALLDAHADHPALAAARERERRLVRRDLGIDVTAPVAERAA